ncbi:MAG: GAF domain-containing protein [Armatimonadota bacterium]
MQADRDSFCKSDLLLISEITTLAISATNLQQLLQTILIRGLEAVGGNRGFIALVDFDSGQLVIGNTAGEGWDAERIQNRLHLHDGDGKGITTYVGATGKPYRTGNVNEDPYYIPYFEDVQSELAVPITDAYGRTRGVINVESPRPDSFTEHHSMLLSTLANLASLGLAVDEHRNRERALVEIGTELASSQDIKSLVSKVIKVAAEVLRFEDCSLFLLDRDRHTLVLEASRGELDEHVGKATYQMGEGLTGWIAEHAQPVRTTDPRNDPRWRGLHCEFPPEETGAFLGVPIEARDGVVGVLRVLRRKSRFPWFRNEFTSDDENVLMSIASQVGAVIQNLRLVDRVVNAERMAAWGEMSARSAHMIGNRVFAIKGHLNEMAYALSQEVPDTELLRQLLEQVQKGIFRLEELLQEFRDFVLATQLSPTEQDINRIVKQAVEESFPKRSPVRLELSLASDLPLVLADPVKLKRCFSELIENAVNFQTEGGVLRVGTNLASPNEARKLCGLSSKRQYVKVEFADRGPGVPDSDKERIFNPFFTSRAKGMGLGLSIVKGIVEAHHGRICEVGTPGSGARFVILLPVNGGSNPSGVQSKS